MNYAQRNNGFTKSFAAGQIVRAVIRTAGEGCVFCSVPGACSAVLSAKAFGEGKDRDRAMKALRVGDSMSLRVKAWYPANRQLLFEEVAEDVSRIRAVAKAGRKTSKFGSHGKTYADKPQYQLLPKGTLFLVDGANYLGQFNPGDAAWALAGLSAGLADAYEIGGEGVERDFKKSAKYWSMRERFQKIQRERSRRRRRLQVEHRRSGLLARCA